MRIALVAPPWIPVPPPSYGGTERVVSLLADGLAARGHDVTLFAAPGSDSKATVVTPLPEVPAYVGADRDDEAAHVLAAYRAVDEFDVVHDHTSLGPVLAACDPHGPPVVHTLHGPWTPALRRKLALASHRVHLVAISHAQRRTAPEFPHAGVVYNGIDVDAHPFAATKDDVVCFVGRSSPDKGPEVAIEVARRAGVPLVMVVKRSEPEELAFWNDAVRPRLGEDVTVLEQAPEDEMRAQMARARAVLSPIAWPEPFGLVLAEAQACGTPVITRPLGAAPELVVDRKTGFLCGTAEEMAAAVRLSEMCAPHECRAHVREHLSSDVMVARYEAVYEQVLRARRSAVG